MFFFQYLFLLINLLYLFQNSHLSNRLQDIPEQDFEERTALKHNEQNTVRRGGKASRSSLLLLKEVYDAIRDGAEAFLYAEYSICAIFVALFSIVVFGLISWCVCYFTFSFLFCLLRNFFPPIIYRQINTQGSNGGAGFFDDLIIYSGCRD